MTDSTPFSRELDYYLKRRQWITACGDYRQYLPKLRDALSDDVPSKPKPVERKKEVVNETQSTYRVVLTNAGAAKLQVVKAVKEAMRLGLKEAKDLVDAAPSVVQEGLTYQQAKKLKEELNAAGAVVDVQAHKKGEAEKTNIRYSVILFKTGQ